MTTLVPANAEPLQPKPNIPPDPDEGNLQWGDGGANANSKYLEEAFISRYEILVPYSTAPTLQAAVKKRVAILLANSIISIVPHVPKTYRNNVKDQNDFPIEKVAMSDYISDVGKEFHNGRPFFKASFLVESCESLAQIKKKRKLWTS